MSAKTELVAQLNALLRLTNTETMIAETRRMQATRSDIEKELATNAEKGRERARMLADSIRQLGGVPDVVGAATGRLAATAKAAAEQGQAFTDAVLGDLALEHELLDRTRLATMIADRLEVSAARRTLERLERAHTETIDWLMTRLAEVAEGGPAALRPTPLQSVIGFSRRLGTMPVRNASGTVNRTIEDAGRVRRQAVAAVRTNGGRVRELVEAAGDIWTAGRDASLKRTEEIADERGDRTQAQAIKRRRRELGAVDSSELPIRGYDALRVDAAIARIGRLTDADDVRAVLAYESAHKARKGVIEAARTQLERLAEKLAAAS
jgi:bacterioferritin (cytochrome b1)